MAMYIRSLTVFIYSDIRCAMKTKIFLAYKDIHFALHNFKSCENSFLKYAHKFFESSSLHISVFPV